MCGGLLGYCRSEFGVNRECSESELCQRERYFYSLGVVNVPRIKDSSIAHDNFSPTFSGHVIWSNLAKNIGGNMNTASPGTDVVHLKNGMIFTNSR